LIYGLTKPKISTQGVEFAGEIAAIGKAVKLFAPGDLVFGMSPDHFGAHAEYLCLPETNVIIKRSPTLSSEAAAALTDGSVTALTFLRDVAKLQRGQKVLINGASGAVGAYAVQLAKHFGAEVTGVCSTANLDLVKSLGAATVIDYTQVDFTKTGQRYDVIFDAVSKRSFTECKDALTPNGLYLVTVPALSLLWQIAWTALRGGKKVKFTTAGLLQNKENLQFIQSLFEAGELKPVIDRRYPLEQIADAHRYVETGRKKGNVVIQVCPEPINH